MAWIRSEKAILNHPKTLMLSSILKVDIETAIGRLHMLWWWCLDYALDGDLSKHSAKVIESSCRIPLKVLKKSGFVDETPFVRIHDWWDNQGNYLKLRFRDQPDKWKRIKESYDIKSHMSIPMSKHVSTPTGKPVDVDLIRLDLQTDVRSQTDGRTDVDLPKSKSRLASLAPGGASLAAHEKHCTCENCFNQKMGGKKHGP